MAVMASRSTKRWIILVGLAITLAGVVGVSWQLYKLTMTEYGQDMRNGAITQQLRTTQIPAQRGNIYDRNGNILAQSATVWNVTISPSQIAEAASTSENGSNMAQLVATHLSNILEDVSYEEVYEKASDKDKGFAYIKKKITRPVMEEILEAEEEYGLVGIYFEEDTKRYYPYGNFAATVLGF